MEAGSLARPLVARVLVLSAAGQQFSLAQFGVDLGLLEVVASWEEWEEGGSGGLTSLPSTLPLGPGLWLPATVMSVDMEKEAVHLHWRLIHPATSFAKFREEIAASLAFILPQVGAAGVLAFLEVTMLLNFCCRWRGWRRGTPGRGRLTPRRPRAR